MIAIIVMIMIAIPMINDHNRNPSNDHHRNPDHQVMGVVGAGIARGWVDTITNHKIIIDDKIYNYIEAIAFYIFAMTLDAIQ